MLRPVNIGLEALQDSELLVSRQELTSVDLLRKVLVRAANDAAVNELFGSTLGLATKHTPQETDDDGRRVALRLLGLVRHKDAGMENRHSFGDVLAPVVFMVVARHAVRQRLYSILALVMVPIVVTVLGIVSDSQRSIALGFSLRILLLAPPFRFAVARDIDEKPEVVPVVHGFRGLQLRVLMLRREVILLEPHVRERR
jgi:hypothetical protein